MASRARAYTISLLELLDEQLDALDEAFRQVLANAPRCDLNGYTAKWPSKSATISRDKDSYHSEKLSSAVCNNPPRTQLGIKTRIALTSVQKAMGPALARERLASSSSTRQNADNDVWTRLHHHRSPPNSSAEFLRLYQRQKEALEMSECSFHPKISKSSAIIANQRRPGSGTASTASATITRLGVRAGAQTPQPPSFSVSRPCHSPAPSGTQSKRNARIPVASNASKGKSQHHHHHHSHSLPPPNHGTTTVLGQHGARAIRTAPSRARSTSSPPIARSTPSPPPPPPYAHCTPVPTSMHYHQGPPTHVLAPVPAPKSNGIHSHYNNSGPESAPSSPTSSIADHPHHPLPHNLGHSFPEHDFGSHNHHSGSSDDSTIHSVASVQHVQHIPPSKGTKWLSNPAGSGSVSGGSLPVHHMLPSSVPPSPPSAPVNYAPSLPSTQTISFHSGNNGHAVGHKDSHLSSGSEDPWMTGSSAAVVQEKSHQHVQQQQHARPLANFLRGNGVTVPHVPISHGDPYGHHPISRPPPRPVFICSNGDQMHSTHLSSAYSNCSTECPNPFSQGPMRMPCPHPPPFVPPLKLPACGMVDGRLF